MQVRASGLACLVASLLAMSADVDALLVPGPWSDNTKLPPLARARMLLANLTQEEKLGFLHGGCSGYVFNSCGVPRLGIPNVRANDGPQGFRGPSGTSTAWPSGLAIGATFDLTAARLWGEAQGREFALKGANVQLGPGLCLARTPNGGRAFEYMSGEDPYLGYTIVQPAVQGIQSQGVVANGE